MWCLATTQPFSRNGRQRSKSTVFEKDLERSFSRPFLHPSPHPHTTTTHNPQPPQPPQPPHLFTILATALQRHRKIQHPHPIAPRHFPHTYSQFLRPLRLYNIAEKYSASTHRPTPPSTHLHSASTHTCSRYLRPLWNVTEKFSTSTHRPTPSFVWCVGID